MQIGLNTDSLADHTVDETLDRAAELGLDCVEFATGGWSDAPHLNLDHLLEHEPARHDLRSKLDERDLSVSALTVSGNPLAPGPGGREHDEQTRKTIRLAAEWGVPRIVLMSGLPPAPGDAHPNWIVAGWPPEATELLERQWREQVFPYWHGLTSYARDHGIDELCLEMHAQQIVYNVPGLLRLRDEVGPVVGANFDPSHLMWMGADPIASVRALGEAIYHVHAKDTRIEEPAALRSNLENLPLDGDPAHRAWNYVTLGEGHDASWWQRFCAALDGIGYRGVLSIEHEDARVKPVDGVRTTVDLLRRIAPTG